MTEIKTKGFDFLTNEFQEQIKAQKDFIAVTTIIVMFLSVIITIITIKSVLKHIKMKDNLDSTNNLLKQYKDAIDVTNIVSKTDPKGFITYANNEFCKISQYDIKELIGKPHNIIRSKDMKSETFEELWKTIKGKKIWNGIVKNRKKDGSSYYVDTTILPILDKDEKISEYIAIRKNVTELIELNMALTNSQEEILSRMGMIAETRSKETGYHVKRVAEYSKVLAEGLGMDKDKVELLYNASTLHDIGKVGTPDHILHKPGKLTDDEFKTMKEHTINGYDMLRDSKNKIVKTGAVIAHEHHEKYDGTGYPRGLKGDEIHIYARITAIADVFDALGESRSYKKAWELSEIIEFINEQSGKHFDPELVKIFNNEIAKFLYIRKKFKNPAIYE